MKILKLDKTQLELSSDETNLNLTRGRILDTKAKRQHENCTKLLQDSEIQHDA